MNYECYRDKDILFSKLCFWYFDKFVFDIHNCKITKKADLG